MSEQLNVHKNTVKIISEHTEKPTLMSMSQIIFENQREYYLQFEKIIKH